MRKTGQSVERELGIQPFHEFANGALSRRMLPYSLRSCDAQNARFFPAFAQGCDPERNVFALQSFAPCAAREPVMRPIFGLNFATRKNVLGGERARIAPLYHQDFKWIIPHEQDRRGQPWLFRNRRYRCLQDQINRA